MAVTHVKGEINTVNYTAGATISSGDVIVLGVVDAKKCRVGVALTDIANGSVGAVAITGCFTFVKVSAAVIGQGDAVNWDSNLASVEDNAHTTGAGDVAEFGMADAAAAATVLTCDVWIDTPGTYDAA